MMRECVSVGTANRGLFYAMVVLCCIAGTLLHGLAYAAAFCAPGPNGMYVIGNEYAATACPVAGDGENTAHTYIVTALICQNGQVTMFAPYGDTVATPAQLQQFGLTNTFNMHRVFRSAQGTHFLYVHDNFTGTLENVNVGALPTYQVHTDVLKKVFMPAGSITAEQLTACNYPAPALTHDTGNVCSNSTAMGSSANLKSGNLNHRQDIITAPGTLSFALVYNSLATTDIPVGKGWTHSLNLQISMEGGGTLLLRTGDGNLYRYALNGGTYLPEARTGDTSTIVRNADSSYTRTLKDGSHQQFNSSGRLTVLQDQNGNQTTLSYSGSDLVQITESGGRSLVLDVNGGRIVTITDPLNRIWTFTYNGNLLSSITNPAAGVWSFSYDGSGRMTGKTDPANNSTTYTYDANGKVTSSVDPESKTKTVSYDTANNRATITGRDGSTWLQKYDPVINAVTEKTDPIGNITKYTYDAKGNVLSSTAPDNSVTTYTYDANSNMLSETDPMGNVTRYTYNSLGKPLTMTAPKGEITTYSYDAKGNLLSITDPAGAATTFTYDTKGNVLTITDAKGAVTPLTYDGQNNLTQTTDPFGKITKYTYDAVGNRLSMTDPLNNIATYEYDALNRLIKVTDPKGAITQLTYDANGNLLRAVDGNGNPTDYQYNYRGQTTQITDALSNLTKLQYGGAGCGGSCSGAEKLTALTDALNHSTTYQYDAAGRLIKETDPMGGVVNYAYDSKGNLTQKTKADGKTILYQYDLSNRLTQKTYSDGTVTQYQYDQNGNLTYAGNADMAYNFAYDALNRLVGITDSNSRTIQYQYDQNGNRTKVTTPEGREINYTYDSRNWLTGITAPGGNYTIQNFADGRRYSLSYPNGAKAVSLYDKNGNPALIKHTAANGNTIAIAGYTYDNANNRTKRNNTAYSYDPTYQLTQATDGSTTEQYRYDAVGNRQYGPKTTDTYMHDDGNEMLSQNAASFTYDANGNRITKSIPASGSTPAGGVHYSYDDENRLIKIEIAVGGTTVSISTYKYDPFGRRIEKNANGTITRYFYDNEDIVLEYDAANAVTARYTHGPGIDEPLAIEKNGQTYYYHADGLGSIVALSGQTGALVQAYGYDSFGNLKNWPTAVIQPYMYTGREFDPEKGTYHYRARDYDPKAGRFLQKDPIGFKAGDVNIFRYTNNNPVNYIDPWGLAYCSYSISSHTLTCISNNYDRNKTSYSMGPNGVFSGISPCRNNNSDPCAKSKDTGPIPQGNYRMNPDDRPGHKDYWRLEPDPKISGLSYYFGARGGFMLHPGSLSLGCITADKHNADTMAQYNAVNKLLKSESGSNYLRVIP